MQVTIHLRKDVADCFRNPTIVCPDATLLQAVLERLGINIHPLHSNPGNSELSTHYYCIVANATDAMRVADELLRQPGVEGTYMKPPDEPPA